MTCLYIAQSVAACPVKYTHTSQHILSAKLSLLAFRTAQAVGECAAMSYCLFWLPLAAPGCRYKPHPGTMCHGRGQHMTNKCWVQSFHHGCAGGGASWISAAQGNSQMLEYVHFDMPYLETLSGDDLDLVGLPW